jgi:hypothetical protein
VGAGGARGERMGEPGDIARRGVRTTRRADGLGSGGGREAVVAMYRKEAAGRNLPEEARIGGETVCLGESDPAFYRHLVRNSVDDGTTGGDAPTPGKQTKSHVTMQAEKQKVIGHLYDKHMVI